MRNAVQSSAEPQRAGTVDPASALGYPRGPVGVFLRRYMPYVLFFLPGLSAVLVGASMEMLVGAVVLEYMLQFTPPAAEESIWIELVLEIAFWGLMLFYMWPVFGAHRIRRRDPAGLSQGQLARARWRIFNFPPFLVAMIWSFWALGLLAYFTSKPADFDALPVILVALMAVVTNAIIGYYFAELLNRVFFIPDWFAGRPVRTRNKLHRPTFALRFFDLFLVNGVIPVAAILGVVAIAYQYGVHDSAELERTLIAAGVTGAVLLGFGLLLTLMIAYVFTVPLQHMAASAKAIAEQRFDTRVVVQSDDHIGQLQLTLNRMGEQLGRLEMMKTLFGHYVSPEIRDLILNGKVKTDSGERIEAVVLFSDVRSFTTMMEEHSAEDVVRMLNIHFSRIVSAVTGFNGFVDKFIGDAVMAVFDAELCENQHQILALSAAIEIIKGMQQTNAEIAGMGFAPLQIGIGMACGPVVRGNIGSESRRELTVMGDTVNIASRLESETKGIDERILLTSAGFREHCENMRGVRMHSPPPVQLRGKRDPVEVLALDLSN